MHEGCCRCSAWFVLTALTAVSLGGCSEGRWFPEVDGPPKGEEWMYHSPNNTDPSLWPPQPSAEESYRAREEWLREKERQQERSHHH